MANDGVAYRLHTNLAIALPLHMAITGAASVIRDVRQHQHHTIMGAAYYIVLEAEIDGWDTMMDGKSLSRHIESLDSVAKELGVRPLTQFTSMDGDALADVLGDDADGIEVPPLQQFSARDGLTTIRALLPRPEAQPALQDLKDCDRILSVAAQRGVGWHFQIDI
jgi:hypothetical protein